MTKAKCVRKWKCQSGFFIVVWIRVRFILKVVHLLLKLNDVKVWSCAHYSWPVLPDQSLHGNVFFFTFQVADSNDVFPLASCFDDRQYELSWQRQQWQRCKNNVPKVQEIFKLPGIFHLHYIIQKLLSKQQTSQLYFLS